MHLVFQSAWLQHTEELLGLDSEEIQECIDVFFEVSVRSPRHHHLNGSSSVRSSGNPDAHEGILCDVGSIRSGPRHAAAPMQPLTQVECPHALDD